MGSWDGAIHVAGRQDDDKTASYHFLPGSYRSLRRIRDSYSGRIWNRKKEKFFDVIDKMAEDAMASGSPSNTRKDLTVEDLKKIYKALW